MKPQTLAAIMKHFSILICFLFLLGCNQTDNTSPDMKISKGGYDYLLEIQDSSFFFYPLASQFSRSDSFRFAWYGSQFLNAFEESNLSINPRPTTELRLAWEPGSLDTTRPVVIVVRKNEIVVKEGQSGHIYAYEDTMRLSSTERFHLELLDNFFPFNSPNHRPWRQRYLDSIVERNPKLASPKYYIALKEKSATNLKPFKYSTTRMVLKEHDYFGILRMVNSSGFWSMSYMMDCPLLGTDAGGFIFEVNAPNKYNMVHGLDCQGDTSKLRQACQKIVELAGMEKKINLIWRN